MLIAGGLGAMSWRAIASGIVEHLEQVPSPKWLGLVATFACVVLLLALIALAERHLHLRRRLADGQQGPTPDGEHPAGWEDELAPISLEGEGRAMVDNLLPRRPRPFLLTVAILALGCWTAGFALAVDPYAFLTSREWQLQPVYLAAHFVTLRLFATMFTRNFLAGVVYLDMPAADARRGITRVQGPLGALVAVLVALPFCLYDVQALGSGEDGGKGGAGTATEQLLYAVWCLEWFLMAFIWVQLVGFLLLTRSAIGDYSFRAPIEVVLLERHYRHFLAMSAHGASIVLGFFLVNVAYGWYTGSELSDYVGVAITLLLLVIGFIPPWMQLTRKMDRIVKGEMAWLRRRIAGSGLLSPAGAMPATQPEDIHSRLDEALVMLRIAYLERLHGDLGNMEARSIVMKVGVPLVTVVYYAVHIFRTAS